MAVKKPVVNKKKTNIVAPKSNAELLGSIDASLKSMNDFLQGEFFEKVESLDWKVWELHNRAEKNDQALAALEDIKALMRVHLMGDGSQPNPVAELSGKPTSIVGKLFKSKK
jgi:hypothetical protein